MQALSSRYPPETRLAIIYHFLVMTTLSFSALYSYVNINTPRTKTCKRIATKNTISRAMPQGVMHKKFGLNRPGSFGGDDCHTHTDTRPHGHAHRQTSDPIRKVGNAGSITN